MDKRTELLNKILQNGFPDKEVVVSVEEFFDGNDDSSSIGCNIYPDPPSLQTFYETFKRLKATDEIENIFIRIADIEDTVWFYTDTVFIIGDITIDDLKEMVKDLRPDEIYSGWMYGLPANLNNLNIDKKVYSIFWD